MRRISGLVVWSIVLLLQCSRQMSTSAVQWEQTGVHSESQPGWMQQCQYYYPEHADTVISGALRARMAPTGRRIDEFVCAVWQSGAIASPRRGGGFSGVLSRPGAAAFVLLRRIVFATRL
jgi:hypothetical protein